MRPLSPLVVLLAALAACAPDPAPVGRAGSSTAVATPAARVETLQPDTSTDPDREADSLMAAATRSPGSGAPYPGDWTPTRQVAEERFTLEIPERARAGWDRRDPHAEHFVVSALPECRW